MATVLDDLMAGEQVDPSGLTDDELRVAVLASQLARSRLAVEAASLLVEWESRGGWCRDGTLRAAVALSRDGKRCPRSARRELHRARRLTEMGHTREAVLAGWLGIDHVDLILQYATDARWRYFLRDEELLVGELVTQRLWDDARRILAYWAMRVDDELDVELVDGERSRVCLSRHEVTGAGELQGHLGAVDAEIVDGELNRLMRQITREDKANGITRTAAERRAEALVLMASRSVNASGATARPLFQIVVGADVATHLCETASGIVLHPSELERWLGSAILEAFLFDGPTTIIGVSRERTFTAAVRRAIQVRDRHCQHTSGCSVRFPDCDVDHVTPWALDGQTAQHNGRVLCTSHNRHSDLRDQPTPLTPRRYSQADETTTRHDTCAAFFHDATAPPAER